MNRRGGIQIRLFPGLWIVAGVSAVLALSVGWSCLERPHNLEGLASDYGSIYLFQKPPVISHAGTLIGSIHTTERGVGVFIANPKSRTELKICEVKSMDYMNDLSHYNMEANQVFGWSPGDGTFAFLWNYQLYFLPTGGEKTNYGAVSNGIRTFAWLSPESCAYIDDGNTLAWIKHSNGQWQQQASWSLSKSNGLPRSLMAITPETVAWTTDNHLWQMRPRLRRNQPVVFRRAKANHQRVVFAGDRRVPAGGQHPGSARKNKYFFFVGHTFRGKSLRD